MAGLGRRTFAPGEVLTASNVMGYLQDQAVMKFAGTAARGSAIGTAVSAGMTTYLTDSNMIEAYDGSAWQRHSAGLVPVSPSSVTIATGSGSANAVGVVSFTGASAVTINGVFTSAYKNYRLVINIANSSQQTSIAQQLASGGTAYTGADYFWAGNWQSITGSGPAILAGASQVAWYMVEATNSVSWFNHTQDIFNPAAANVTSMTGSGVTYSSGWRHVSYSCLSQTSASFDGMKFSLSTAGTFTGTIQVFGYND